MGVQSLLRHHAQHKLAVRDVQRLKALRANPSSKLGARRIDQGDSPRSSTLEAQAITAPTGFFQLAVHTKVDAETSIQAIMDKA